MGRSTAGMLTRGAIFNKKQKWDLYATVWRGETNIIIYLVLQQIEKRSHTGSKEKWHARAIGQREEVANKK